jgi:adenylate cyclase
MGVEIERKFLVRGDGWREGRPLAIRQAYLSRDAVTVRVRREGERGVLTLKGPSVGLARPEFEYEIPVADADALIALSSLPPIEKTRYLVSHAGRTWEVDEFHGANAGLVVAEIELDSEREEIELPEWVGEEVSADPRYRNSSLAAVPFCDWDAENQDGV